MTALDRTQVTAVSLMNVACTTVSPMLHCIVVASRKLKPTSVSAWPMLARRVASSTMTEPLSSVRRAAKVNRPRNTAAS